MAGIGAGYGTPSKPVSNNSVVSSGSSGSSGNTTSVVGYGTSGKSYNISSEKGLDFINSAVPGSTLTGGDGSSWTKNADGTTTIQSDGDTFTVASSIGNLQLALDNITRQSELSSARSLEYALQHQEWSAQQAQIARDFNAAEAAKNRDWQEYMSNTAHQREIADLKAAGLNPVLSAMGGNGASVTSGSAASANIPSGSSGQSDMSGNSAIVSILSSMLSAQTQLTNAAVSARTQEAVADKYTAMSRLTAEIAAAASMYGADTQYNIQKDFPNSMIRVLDSILSDSGTSIGSVGGKLANEFYELLKKLTGNNSGSDLFGRRSGNFNGKVVK